MDARIVNISGRFDLLGVGNDVLTTNSFDSMIPIALFGGNPEQSTPNTRVEGEQAFDYWGNALLMQNEPQQQLNSRTQKILSISATTSANRALIENAVKADLKFMADFADIAVSVSMPQLNRVKIDIQLTRPDNLQTQNFVFVWDSLKQQLLSDELNIYKAPQPQQQNNNFNYNLNFNFS